MSPPTNLPTSCAAATVLSVAALIDALSCSAITRIVICSFSEFYSKHLGFGLQLLDERLHIRHLHTGGALPRLSNLQRLQARLHVNAKVFRLERFHWLLLRLHDVGQRHVARLIEAQVTGDHRRQ